MRHKDDRKAKLIRDKAIEMIVKEGFDGLSMQKLAKAAGISASTIYIYFENREDMLVKLYSEVLEDFEEEVLQDFDPEMAFAEGLWLQWKNRYKNFTDNPMRYFFWEQFRHSPLIHNQRLANRNFGRIMRQFISNAVAKGEMIDLEPDVFRALAFSPLYMLLKIAFERNEGVEQQVFPDEEKLHQTFERVLKSLCP